MVTISSRLPIGIGTLNRPLQSSNETPAACGVPPTHQTANGPDSTIRSFNSVGETESTSTAAGERYLSVQPMTAQPSLIGHRWTVAEGDFSALHCVDCSDELWHLYGGGPLELHLIHEDGAYEQKTLTTDPMRGEPRLLNMPGWSPRF